MRTEVNSQAYKDRLTLIGARVVYYIDRHNYNGGRKFKLIAEPSGPMAEMTNIRTDELSALVLEIMRLLCETKVKDPAAIVDEALNAISHVKQLEEELEKLKNSPALKVGQAAIALAEVMKTVKP